MDSPSLSTWSKWSDNDHSNNDTSLSPPRSPFTAALNTSRPAGILINGIQEVPSSISEYLKDLYNALEVQF
jgi:hypothetical protein